MGTGGCVYAATEELEGSVLGSHSGASPGLALPSFHRRVNRFPLGCGCVRVKRDANASNKSVLCPYSRVLASSQCWKPIWRRLQPARSGLVVSAREIVAGAHPRCFNVGRLFLPG